QVRIVEAVDFLDAGGARDVDLGDEAADDVEADEVETVEPEAGRHPAADLSGAVVDGAPDHPAADADVAAGLGRAGHAEDRAERLAVEDDQALVAVTHGGEVALRHHEARAFDRRHLEERVQVAVGAVDVQDAGAPAAVERLDDHLAAETLHEGLQ